MVCCWGIPRQGIPRPEPHTVTQCPAGRVARGVGEDVVTDAQPPSATASRGKMVG
jgi:hypothetical protein